MIVTAIKGFTNVLGAPKDWDPSINGECLGLPVKIEQHGDTISVTSEWKPTPEEMVALAAGAALHLRVIGGQPPVALYVDGIPENLTVDFNDIAVQREALLAQVVRMCRDQFASYASLHQAKGTAEGSAKAEINLRLAEICAAALAGHVG